MGKQASDHPNTQFTRTGSQECEGWNQRHDGSRVVRTKPKTAGAGGSLPSSNSSQSFPRLQEWPEALALFASAPYSSNWWGEKDFGPSERAPSPPPKRHRSAGEKSTACGSVVGEEQRTRPPGRGAELARTDAGMASQPAPSASHPPDLTPRFPLTYVPRCRHLPRCGSRYCGSSDCGPAFASFRGSLVSQQASGLLTGATAAELPLDPLPRRRRSLTPSPPSVLFRLSPARAVCRGRGSEGGLGAGGVAQLASASGSARSPALLGRLHLVPPRRLLSSAWRL